ncbi:MAG: ATP-binding protein [Syntrophomonadaceae bacterium]
MNTAHRFKNLRVSSNDIFSKLFYENQVLMVLTHYEDGIILDVNHVCRVLSGYTREELIGRNVCEMAFYVDPEARQELVKRICQDGYIRNLEIKCRDKYNNTKYVLLSSSILEVDGETCLLNSLVDITSRRQAIFPANAEGEKYRLGSLQDITWRQQAKSELNRSKKLFYQLFDNLPLPTIIVSSKDKRIVEVNDAFLAFSNMTRKDIAALQGKGKKMPPAIYRFYEMVAEQGLVKSFECNYRSPSGEDGSVLVSGVIINWEGEECVLSIGIDITQLRRYQTEMVRMENLHVIGQMAASIAHEVRNPMTTIKGFLQLFQNDENYREDHEDMRLMVAEIDRVNEIVSSFLSLSQMNLIELKAQSLNNRVTTLIPVIIAEASGKDIAVKTKLRKVPPVLLDDGEFRQMLLNLARNGIEAMTEGETLTIRTFADQGGINLQVEDHGQGIPEAILGRLGSPFVTTKETGSGLGLAVCYSIAERHDARIKIETGPAGTRVTVIFPPPA